MPEAHEIPSHQVPAISIPRAPPASLPVPNSTLSFWHTEPDEFLLRHRTTENLPEYVDVCIVGSGITGTSAARFLTESGQLEGKVLMLEAREVCSGATGRNGGHLQPLLYNSPPDIAAFELKNCSEVASFIEDNGIQCEYRAVTGCRTFWTEELASQAKVAVQRLAKYAPDLSRKVKWIGPEQELDDAMLKHECQGGTLTYGAASLWPYKYIGWILRHLVQDGKLNLQTNTAVTDITPIPESSEQQPTPAGARHALTTTRGTVYARTVLLATNAYTSALLPRWSDLIVPIRETMSALFPPPCLTRSLLPHSYGFEGLGPDPNPQATEYLIQRPVSGVPNPRGHLMLGGGRIAAASLPSVGISDDSVLDDGVVQYLRRALPRALQLGEAAGEALELDRAWSGIWGKSRDGAPWVGKVPGADGLWLCGAYSGHGMPNATLCAKAMVRMMVEEAKGRDVAQVQDELVAAGAIPRSYLLTAARLEAARSVPPVEELEDQGLDGLGWLEGQQAGGV